MNVGFIGVGYMGYGIAKNILINGNNLFVIANKKRAPIDKIVSAVSYTHLTLPTILRV